MSTQGENAFYNLSNCDEWHLPLENYIKNKTSPVTSNKQINCSEFGSLPNYCGTLRNSLPLSGPHAEIHGFERWDSEIWASLLHLIYTELRGCETTVVHSPSPGRPPTCLGTA